MIPGRLLVHRINLVAQGVITTDEYNNDVVGETSRLDNVHAWVEQFESQDLTQNRYTVITLWRIMFNDPTPFAIDDLSSIEYGTMTFSLEGRPDMKKTPRGFSHYQVIGREVIRG